MKKKTETQYEQEVRSEERRKERVRTCMFWRDQSWYIHSVGRGRFARGPERGWYRKTSKPLRMGSV